MTHPPHPGMLELSILPTLSVHCFSRDGRDAGPGPLFILREWDLKVIRTIGHKPKCKGPNQEQALRACVRQGLLSMQLRTENATKDEIQLLKQVGVLGKRAPSGSLIGGADLLKLLEYFSKRDVADAFKAAMKKQRDEGVVSEEVWRDIAAVREKDVVHKFKINTEERREEDDADAAQPTGKGGERRKKKGGGGGGVKSGGRKGGGGSKKRKRRSGEEEGGAGGRKRRRGSGSSSSGSSASSVSSMESEDDTDRKRSRDHHRNSHRGGKAKHGDRRRAASGGRSNGNGGDRPVGDFQAGMAQHEMQQQQAAAFPDVPMAFTGGQRRQGGGGHTVQLLQQPMPNAKRELNGLPVAGMTNRGQFTYAPSGSPPYALSSLSSQSLPHAASPTNGYNGLYSSGRQPSYSSLTSMPQYAVSHTHHHTQPAMQSTIMQPYSSPPQAHGSPLLVSVPSAVAAHSVVPGTSGAQKPDGLEVLMQALHGKESIADASSNGGQIHAQQQRRSSSPRTQQQQQQLDYAAMQQGQMELAQHVQSQHHQLYAQQQHIQSQQQQPPQQPQGAFSHSQERPQVLLHQYLKANSPFAYGAQAPSPAFHHVSKEYSGNVGHAIAAPAPVSMSLPTNVASSTILSPLTMGTATPTSVALHRPQARLSPANSFTNLAALVNPTPAITRNLSSSSLTLGLPNVSSVTSLSSLVGQGGSLSYNQLHTSMSMTSLNAADQSDEDELGGDAGIQNGIITFDDDIEGAELRPFAQAAGGFYHYDPSSSSPLPRIPSIASLTEHNIPRIASNLSTLTSSFLPSPPSSRPSSPRRPAGDTDRGRTPPPAGQAGTAATAGAPSRAQAQAMGQSTAGGGPPAAQGTAVAAEG